MILPFPDIGHLMTAARAAAVRDWLIIGGHLVNMRVLLALVESGVLVLRKGDIVPRDRTEHSSLERVMAAHQHIPPNELVLVTVQPDRVFKGEKSSPVQTRHICSTITNLDIVVTNDGVFFQTKTPSASRIAILIGGKPIPDPGSVSAFKNFALVTSGRRLYAITLRISKASMKKSKPQEIRLISDGMTVGRLEDVHLCAKSVGVVIDSTHVWRMTLSDNADEAVLSLLWTLPSAIRKSKLTCVTATPTVSLVAVGTTSGLVVISVALKCSAVSLMSLESHCRS